MPSEYILSADYATYGLPSNTTQSQVHAASAVVDGALQRPKGAVINRQSGIAVAMAIDGLPIVEYANVPRNGVLQLSYSPEVRVISIERRLNATWQPVQVISGDFDFTDGGNLFVDNLGVSYGDMLRINYVAGWDYTNLPAAIKQAVANIINFSVNANMPGNTKMLRAGDTAIERFDDTAMDGDTRAMLAPYKRVFA